jgi:Replication initiator protein A
MAHEKRAVSYSISRDEMNLAEFPITVLSTRCNPHLKTLEFSDTITSKNGDLINRQWLITGADKFGLPTASDDEILLGLLKLSVDSGMKGRKVYFTRYELLKVLRWSTEGRNYSRLQKALDRLTGVRIKATNAFYDNDAKLHSTKNFGLIDSYEINCSRDGDLKNSFFEWSEVLYKSFQVGFIKKLDLDIYLSLQGAVTKRLYRYLDKHFWYKSRVEIKLFVLAHEKVGVSRNYRFASSLRQQLDPAFEELIEKKVVAEVSYHGRGKDTVVTIIAGVGDFSKKPLISSISSSCSSNPTSPSSFQAGQETRSTESSSQTPAKTNLIEALISRGLTESQSIKVVENTSESLLPKLKAIIGHFDSLLSEGSPRISRSPVGFLYKAVSSPEKYLLPRENKTMALPFQGSLSARPSRLRNLRDSEEDNAAYLIYRRKRIDEYKASMSSHTLQSLTLDVESALSKLRGVIREDHFEAAVQHAVSEKLAKQAQVKSFEEWSKGECQAQHR